EIFCQHGFAANDMGNAAVFAAVERNIVIPVHGRGEAKRLVAGEGYAASDCTGGGAVIAADEARLTGSTRKMNGLDQRSRWVVNIHVDIAVRNDRRGRRQGLPVKAIV